MEENLSNSQNNGKEKVTNKTKTLVYVVIGVIIGIFIAMIIINKNSAPKTWHDNLSETKIMQIGKDKIKEQLNYPSTFNLLHSKVNYKDEDYNDEYYCAFYNCIFTAQNAFGLKLKYTATVEIRFNKEDMKYTVLDPYMEEYSD